MQYSARRLAAILMAATLPFSMLSPTTSWAEAVSEKEAVYGIWSTSGTMIEVSPTADGGLSARIIALKNPLWREKDGVGVVGEPKTDLHNPDESQHQRPFIGLEMLSDYEFRKGKWRGKLYLPSNGTTWSSTAQVKKGVLQIRGHIGLPVLGKTQKFEPLASCNKNILRMLTQARMTGTPCDELLAVDGAAEKSEAYREQKETTQ
jgi:uncharacterized protein (DUF2147 family)